MNILELFVWSCTSHSRNVDSFGDVTKFFDETLTGGNLHEITGFSTRHHIFTRLQDNVDFCITSWLHDLTTIVCTHFILNGKSSSLFIDHLYLSTTVQTKVCYKRKTLLYLHISSKLLLQSVIHVSLLYFWNRAMCYLP